MDIRIANTEMAKERGGWERGGRRRWGEGRVRGSGWMAAIKRFHPSPPSPAAPIYKGE